MKGDGVQEAALRALPASSAPLAAAVLEAARRRGFAVHLVGGPVRDLLLGRPVRDVDLVVEVRDGEGAAELAEAAAGEGVRIVRHERFGTIRLEGGEGALDLATVRSERYAHPGALPTVAPGTLEEDLRRRDFTVNALAIPLSGAAKRGRPPVVDPADGQRDLEARTLRILHPRSFHDDPTRALRAARLAARLGFTLSRGSRSALRDALRDGAFGRVSGERLRREVEKLFEDACQGLDPARALQLLAEWHVLGALEPGLELPRSAVAPLRRLGRALGDPPWPEPRLRPWAAGLAVWLAPFEAGLRARTLRRFAVRGEPAERIARQPRLQRALLRSLAKARGRGAIDAALAGLAPDQVLALYVGSPPALRRRVLRWALEDRARRAPVDGADLVSVGLEGPLVGRALARIRAAWLDGGVRGRDEALALAREIARRARPRPRMPGPRAPRPRAAAAPRPVVPPRGGGSKPEVPPAPVALPAALPHTGAVLRGPPSARPDSSWEPRWTRTPRAANPPSRTSRSSATRRPARSSCPSSKGRSTCFCT